MSADSGDRRVVSIAALVKALRGEYVTDGFIHRVLVAVLGVDEATARAYAEGRVPAAEVVPEVEAVPEVESEPAPVDDHATLHAMLTAAQERGDWPEFAALIGRIVEIEPDVKRRAKYLYTLALIQRDQLRDDAAALETLGMVLDSDPSLVVAFEREKAILVKQEDWRGLDRAYRRMIRRVRGEGDAALDFGLWQGLGQVYRDRLGDSSAALAAFQMALTLRPDDADTRAAVQALGG